MSHDTGHGHSKENVTIISFKNSFWLVVIIVGLFIAALNFIQAESHGEGEGEGHGGHHTEAAAGHGGHGAASSHDAEGHQEAKEATQTNEGPAPAGEEHKAEETKPAEEAHH